MALFVMRRAQPDRMNGGLAHNSQSFFHRIDALSCARTLIMFKLIFNVLMLVSIGAIHGAQGYVKAERPLAVFLRMYCMLTIAQTMMLYLKRRKFSEISYIEHYEEGSNVRRINFWLETGSLLLYLLGFIWVEERGRCKDTNPLLYYTCLYCIISGASSFIAPVAISTIILLPVLWQFLVSGCPQRERQAQAWLETSPRSQLLELERRQQQRELEWRQRQRLERRQRLGEQEWGRRQLQGEQERERRRRRQQWHRLPPEEQQQLHREQERQRQQRELQRQQRRRLWQQLPQEEQERQRQREQLDQQQRCELERQQQVQQLLQQLTIITYLTEDDVPGGYHACMICFDDYTPGDEVAFLPCHHHFHAGCVRVWLHVKISCPLCRKRIVLDTDT
ncbi:hypothetical protein PAPHI01_1514 [Pancytospora philotis]|nr:hypothetical protein PAPHI01_1514 [Pancytospora philotis]